MAKFKRGLSGNPAGRPKGGTDRRTELRALLTPHAPGLIQRAVQLALGGDVAALRLCLDRLLAPIKTQDEPVTLDKLATGAALGDYGRAILGAITTARISPDQGAALLSALASQARIVEFDELTRRIAALEGLK